MRLLLALFTVVICTAMALPASFDPSQIREGGLTGDQAKQVLVVVLKHEKYRLEKRGMDIDGPFKVDPSIPSERGFWEFGLTYDSPKLGATQVLGRYAVSRLTGDVWETNLCKRYDFPSLKRIQAEIMTRTGKTFADEKEARQGLGCTDH
jgi:hypothetical protein